MRIILTLAAAIALAGPASAQIQSGAWTGTGYQVGSNGPQSSWTISMNVHADSASRIDYPSLGCKAVLHQLKRHSDEIEFREEIREGNCITGGTINVRFRDNRVFWFWSKPESGADASAVLYRDQPIG